MIIQHFSLNFAPKKMCASKRVARNKGQSRAQLEHLLQVCNGHNGNQKSGQDFH